MNRIKELRLREGVSCTQLAEIAGISQSMLSKYENGHGFPREMAVWERLAEFFGVSVSHVMGLSTDLGELRKKWCSEGILFDREEAAQFPVTVVIPPDADPAGIIRLLWLF